MSKTLTFLFWGTDKIFLFLFFCVARKVHLFLLISFMIQMRDSEKGKSELTGRRT